MAVIVAIVSGLFSGLISTYYQVIKNKTFRASMLYYDLKSIDCYFKETSDEIANIRYSKDWPENLPYCTFLKPEVVKEISSVYDAIYDYNERFPGGCVDREAYQPYGEAKKEVSSKIQQLLEVIEKNIQNFKTITHLKVLIE